MPVIQRGSLAGRVQCFWHCKKQRSEPDQRPWPIRRVCAFAPATQFMCEVAHGKRAKGFNDKCETSNTQIQLERSKLIENAKSAFHDKCETVANTQIF
jgi:hypothetical protein